MNESAVPLVDVPAASTPAPAPHVHHDPDLRLLSLHLDHPPVEADTGDVLDDLLEEVSELLGPDGRDALTVRLDGHGLRATTVQAILRVVTRDCDRAIQSVQLTPRAQAALLTEAVGRPAELIPEAELAGDQPEVVHTTAPPVRPTLVALEAPPALPPEPPSEAKAEELAAAVPSEPASDTPEPLEPLPLEGAEASEVPEASDVAAPSPAAPAGADAASADEPGTEAASEAPAPASLIDPDLPTEQTYAERFLAEDELPHSRPWGATDDGDRRVLVLRRTIRSGKAVRFSGDVVVFGDVNPGAQVIADGDIVVLGRLRGLAHAGHRGDASAIVVGLDMQSGQVRIGSAIAFPGTLDEPSTSSRLAALLRRSAPSPNRSVTPSVARVVDGELRIEDYRGRLHS